MEEQELRRIFSKNLRHYMERDGINITELSRIIGLDSSTVGKWLNERSTPRMGAVEKLAEYFKVLKSDLLESPVNTIESVRTKKVPLIENFSDAVFDKHSFQGGGSMFIDVDESINCDFCFRADDDSLQELRIRKDDIVFC